MGDYTLRSAKRLTFNRCNLSGHFIISLDFELLWGLRDHANRNSYGKNVLGARLAIPRMLDLFANNDIRATWATVGLLFCESRDEMIEMSPPPELRPRYLNTKLSNYTYFSELGKNEVEDPYYYAASIVDQISKTPGQEIATHTFSHFYPLEPGATLQAFEADLEATQAVARRRSIKIRSIVFPRNQYGDEHVAACRKVGIVNWRGNPSGWAYKPTTGNSQTLARRGLRLIDAHTGVLGTQTFRDDPSEFRNVPASHFLRPCAGKLAMAHPAHIAMVMRSMTHAAKTGRGYHLWWHPHNFGVNLVENIASISKVIAHFKRLEIKYGMISRNMGDQQ